MPFKTTREPNGLLTEWWGHSTNAEMVQMQEQVHRRPDFDSVRYSIHDFSQCERFESSKEDAEYSAAIDRVASMRSNLLKIAIVATNAGVTDMVGRYIGSELSPYPVKFFASLQEARQWIE